MVYDINDDDDNNVQNLMEKRVTMSRTEREEAEEEEGVKLERELDR